MLLLDLSTVYLATVQEVLLPQTRCNLDGMVSVADSSEVSTGRALWMQAKRA